MLLVFAIGMQTGAGHSQGHPLRVESARIGVDQRVYVRWTGHADRVQPAGEAQVGVDGLKISEDRSAVAWLVERSDISDASYPEPFELMVACNGRRPHSIFPGRVISQYYFLSRGTRIAVWDETGHGGQMGEATLYRACTGKLVASWSPDEKTAPPLWAVPFHAEWDGGS